MDLEFHSTTPLVVATRLVSVEPGIQFITPDGELKVGQRDLYSILLDLVKDIKESGYSHHAETLARIMALTQIIFNATGESKVQSLLRPTKPY
jgi:hypothetical protein